MSKRLEPHTTDRLGRRLSKGRLARRKRIMTATLGVITAKGYEGVTVSELADKCQVSKKTLYDIYGSKQGVVASAIAYRMDSVIKRIRVTAASRAFANLVIMTDMTVEAVLEIPKLSRALGPLLLKDTEQFKLMEFFGGLHGQALEEMREDGQLEDWVDIDFTVRSLMFEQVSVQNMWGGGSISGGQYRDFARLSTYRLLVPLTTPALHMHLIDRVRELQNDLEFAW